MRQRRSIRPLPPRRLSAPLRSNGRFCNACFVARSTSRAARDLGAAGTPTVMRAHTRPTGSAVGHSGVLSPSTGAPSQRRPPGRSRRARTPRRLREAFRGQRLDVRRLAQRHRRKPSSVCLPAAFAGSFEHKSSLAAFKLAVWGRGEALRNVADLPGCPPPHPHLMRADIRVPMATPPISADSEALSLRPSCRLSTSLSPACDRWGIIDRILINLILMAFSSQVEGVHVREELE